MRIEWGAGPRFYEQGLDRGVLYLEEGVFPWNGLISLSENGDPSNETIGYFDGVAAHILEERGSEFGGSLEAYMFPEVFEGYNGYSEQETYRSFGLSYRTEFGDGYLIHLVYNAILREPSKTRRTTGGDPNPSTFKWDISTEAVPIPGSRPTSHMVIDSNVTTWATERLEDVLYGTETTEPRLPSPQEIVDIYEASTLFTVIYNGDGSYSIDAPDDMVALLEDGEFELNSPTVIDIKFGQFLAYSYGIKETRPWQQ